MIYLLPFLTSILLGCLAVRLILIRTPPAPALLLFLGSSLGLGCSGMLVVLSLFVLGKFAGIALWLIHALILAGLIIALQKSKPAGMRFPLKDIKLSDFAALLSLGLFILPVIVHARLYPQGGWDAWSCWNLKARFIFLGAENWTNMLDPLLWRSNIAYPFLLPAINAWNWSPGSTPAWGVTLGTSCLITFLTAGTLLFSIKKLTGRLHAFLAPAWFLSIIFIVKLASSQYSDLLVGLYLLTAISGFLFFQQTRNRAWLIIVAMALGFMSFTKTEGLVLAVISALIIIFWRSLFTNDKKNIKPDLIIFIITLCLAFVPTLVFQILFAPDSHTFINGLTSIEKPVSLQRFQAIFVFLGIEFISPKWNGFWLLALTGLLLSGKRCFNTNHLFIPVILILYLLAIIGVYWLNTFYEIIWWLGTTLNRILYALVPSIIFWLFLIFESPSPRK